MGQLDSGVLFLKTKIPYNSLFIKKKKYTLQIKVLCLFVVLAENFDFASASIFNMELKPILLSLHKQKLSHFIYRFDSSGSNT